MTDTIADRSWHRQGTAEVPVVLIHPLAMAGEMWSHVAGRLDPDRTILAPTVPAGQPDAVTVGDMAAHVAATIEAAGTGPADIVGMSMGGCVALHLVLERPDLVRRLVLADTTADYGPDRVANWEQRAVSAETSARTDLLDFQLSRWFSDRFRRENPDACDRAAAVFTGTSPTVHAACCRALGAFDVSGRLGEIDKPALVLVGVEDYATPPAMADALAAGIHGAHRVVLDDARHFSLLESDIAWDLIGAHLADG